MRGLAGKASCRMILGVGLILAVTGALADSSGRNVPLRSGAIQPDRQEASIGESDTGGPERWVVRFKNAPGWHEKGEVETAGGRVIAPLPGQAYLVSVPGAP